MADQGAPVDFGGRVFPNPSGIKPVADTDIKPKPDKYSAGSRGDVASPNWSDPVRPHPLEEHFTKKAAGVRRIKGPAPDVSSN